ncbi:MAG: Nif11-like leader peptide family natural product precursor [Cyanobacteriota bacterium]|nr:Nif11-like leader peptide family natural product precursor [Cyanobacteriota bacterium]
MNSGISADPEGTTGAFDPTCWTMHGDDPRDHPVSKAQLNAFMAKVAADPALKARLDAAADTAAVVEIARDAGHSFSPASWSRHLRG